MQRKPGEANSENFRLNSVAIQGGVSLQAIDWRANQKSRSDSSSALDGFSSIYAVV